MRFRALAQNRTKTKETSRTFTWKSVCSITVKTASLFHFVNSSNASWIVSSAVARACRSLIASIFETTRSEASSMCCSVNSFLLIPFGISSILKSCCQ